MYFGNNNHYFFVDINFNKKGYAKTYINLLIITTIIIFSRFKDFYFIEIGIKLCCLGVYVNKRVVRTERPILYDSSIWHANGF